MENVFLVMELYMGSYHVRTKPIHCFTDKNAAELYVKEGNESQEGKDFIRRHTCEDVEFKFFIEEIKHN
jgi:hypothetical protein